MTIEDFNHTSVRNSLMLEDNPKIESDENPMKTIVENQY